MSKNDPEALRAFAQRLTDALAKKAEALAITRGEASPTARGKTFKPNVSEIARECDTTPQAARAWFEAVSYPRPDKLRKLAAYCWTTPEHLVWGTPEVPAEPLESEFELQHVSRREAQLLTHFRGATSTGKMQLEAAAVNIERLPQEALPPKPAP